MFFFYNKCRVKQIPLISISSDPCSIVCVGGGGSFVWSFDLSRRALESWLRNHLPLSESLLHYLEEQYLSLSVE